MKEGSRLPTDPGLVPRIARRLLAALRPLVFSARRNWIHMTQPGVRIGPGTCIEKGVQMTATDGGAIVIGSNCSILRGVTLAAKGACLEIGDETFVGPWTSIMALNGIVIGRQCLIAERVTVRDQDHMIHGDLSVPIGQSGMASGPIRLDDGAWLAAGAVVLRGVKVGRGSVVAANAVVTRDVPDFGIVGGVPAAVIGKRGVHGQ